MLPAAFLEFAKLLLQFTLEIIKTQPPEVQRQLWEWYVKDIAWWRKFLKIDE